MPLQQNKKSKQKCRQRQAANRYRGLQFQTCPHCGAAKRPHRVCDSCGYYKDKQVLTITAE